MEFRRSLSLSFLFRFNLEVLQKLREMVPVPVSPPAAGPPDGTSQVPPFSQNIITDELPEKIEPLPKEIQASLQEFQVPTFCLQASPSAWPEVPTQLCLCPPQPVSEEQEEQDPVGRPIMHRSALSQATGEAVYCDDLPATDGELFMVLVTSSRAHARIT